MKVARNSNEIPQGLPKPVATLGNFDGVHLGHRHLVAELLGAAQMRNGTSVVITFRPHPVKILFPSRAPSLISTYDEKLKQLERLGVDWVVEVPFNRDFSEWSAERFVDELLVDKLGIDHFLAGPDCHFGRGRAGNADLLTAHGKLKGFTVEKVAPITAMDGVVSSSRIRALVAEKGDIETAEKLLGRSFRLHGTVVKGDERGRTIGFPTANLDLVSELVPLTGVYAARAIVDEDVHSAVVNVGTKPTFGGNQLTVEAHLLDFSRDIYGEKLSLDFVARIRDERRFESVESLIEQITKDADASRTLLE